MRPQYLVGIIIGLLLVYLGFMGAAGIGFSWSNASSLPSIDNFNDLSGWSPYYAGGGLAPVISPVGQLQLHAGAPAPSGSGGGTDDRSAVRSYSGVPGTGMSAANTMTITFRMMVDSWGSSGKIQFQLYSTSWNQAFNVYESRIEQTGGASIGSYAGNNQWHNYSFSITSGSKTDIFFDSTKVGSSSVFGAGVADFYAGISMDAWDGMLCHIDMVDVEPTLYGGGGGGGGGGPSTVTITITGQGTTNATSGSFYTVGQNLYIQATAADGWSLQKFNRNGAEWTRNNPGGFNNLAATENIEVVFVKGSDGGGGGGGGIDLGNFTGIIVGILNNPQVRQLEMAAGGLTTVITGIMFLLPGKKYYPPSPSPRYY